MTSSKPIFLIMTGSHCGTCRLFKENFENKVVEMVEQLDTVTLIRINDGQVNPKVRVNPNILKYLPLVPAFVLITKESWDSNGEPELAMMNMIPGRATPNGFVPTTEGKFVYQRNPSGIKEWLEKELNTNPKFNKSIPESTSASIVNSPYMMVPLKKKVTSSPPTRISNIVYRYDSDSESDS